MMYMPDSNAWIVSFQKPRGLVAQRFADASARAEIVFSDLVKAELLQGALLCNQTENELRRLRALFTLYPNLSFDEAVAEEWARVNVPLRLAGKPIGTFDTAIAATALAHRCTLVTHNRKHFDRVPGLAVEDWEAEGPK